MSKKAGFTVADMLLFEKWGMAKRTRGKRRTLKAADLRRFVHLYRVNPLGLKG